MGAVDPTYPLYTIASALASTMLLLVLMTNFVRHKWNLGVTFLCFWLFVENLTGAVNTVLWSDNADIKLYAYCDIVSHLQVIAYIVKPMATLIISRRLYLIASLRSVELPSQAARRWDLVIEWTLGLIIPVLVAGPIYYVNQGFRFLVYQGSGCASAGVPSILEVLIEESWAIIPPLVSIVFYYPKIVRTYYRQSKDVNSFFEQHIDILLTLPFGIVSIALEVAAALSPPKSFPFYPGWAYLHTPWEPQSILYDEMQALGMADLAEYYFARWTTPVLAFTIFGLFGVTSEARASYRHIICTVCGWFGYKPALHARVRHSSLGDIEFHARSHEAGTREYDLEMRSPTPSLSHAAICPLAGGAEDASAERACRQWDSASRSVQKDLE